MSWSNYFQQFILDTVHDLDTPTVPATVYVGLKTADPTAAGSGGTEPTIGTGGYARIPITQATDLERSGETVDNIGAESFPESTAAWSTGATELTHFEVRDASTAGNLLWYGQLPVPRAVNAAGITLTIPAGALTSRAEPTP